MISTCMILFQIVFRFGISFMSEILTPNLDTRGVCIFNDFYIRRFVLQFLDSAHIKVKKLVSRILAKEITPLSCSNKVSNGLA